MSDLFHEDVSADYVKQVFDVMRRARWHQYQVLTKRSERLLRMNTLLDWRPQIWMGVSVESEDYLFRVDHLRKTGASIKFLSMEPLLGPIHKVDLRGIDWVTVGGESGPGARAVDASWVREIRDRCTRAGVPFFFKQWGACSSRGQVASLTVARGIRCPSSLPGLQRTMTAKNGSLSRETMIPDRRTVSMAPSAKSLLIACLSPSPSPYSSPYSYSGARGGIFNASRVRGVGTPETRRLLAF